METLMHIYTHTPHNTHAYTPRCTCTKYISRHFYTDYLFLCTWSETYSFVPCPDRAGMILRRLKWFVHAHRQRMQLIRKEMQRMPFTLSDSEIPFAVVSALANIRLQSYHFPRTGMDRCFLGNYFCMVKPK